MRLHYVVLLALLGRLPHILLLLAPWPLFDTSPTLPPTSQFDPLKFNRWDFLHFDHIVQNGYTHEHHFAWYPGLFNILSKLPNDGIWKSYAAQALAVTFANVVSTLSLYGLTRRLVPRSKAIADLAVLAHSLLSLSPPTTIVPYSEPFFAAFSFLGMYLTTRRHFVVATFLFYMAANTRANGILLIVHLFYPLFIHPFVAKFVYKIPKASRPPFRPVSGIFLSGLLVLPYFLQMMRGYSQLCLVFEPREWCDLVNGSPPNVYTVVQAKYWGITGPFSYWKLQNLPNFIISIPPFALALYFGGAWLWRFFVEESQFLHAEDESLEVFMDEPQYMVAHVLHAIATLGLLAVMAHVQIVLRVLGAATPVLAWAVSWLVLRDRTSTRKRASTYITYAILWGVTSTVLWATFLPPA